MIRWLFCHWYGQYRLSLKHAKGLTGFQGWLSGLLSWEKPLCELNMLAVHNQIFDHSDISKLQMRLCLSRPISVYILPVLRRFTSFTVLRRPLAIPHNIILCWVSRASRNIFGRPQNCLDFTESPFGPLTEFKFSLISFGSIKDFKQVAEPKQIWYFNRSRNENLRKDKSYPAL